MTPTEPVTVSLVLDPIEPVKRWTLWVLGAKGISEVSWKLFAFFAIVGCPLWALVGGLGMSALMHDPRWIGAMAIGAPGLAIVVACIVISQVK